jgi:hypothetical protein
MGDRGNIVVVQHGALDGGADGAIYLYTHASGSFIARTAQCALIRGADRWTDEPYLGRIVFNEMTAGFERDTMMFGISSYLTDNEHDLVVIDAATQTVSLVSAEPHAAPAPEAGSRTSYSFADFAKLDLVAAGLVPKAAECSHFPPAVSEVTPTVLTDTSALPGARPWNNPTLLIVVVLAAAAIAVVLTRPRD